MTQYNFNCNEAPEPVDFSPMPINTECIMEIIASEIGAANEKGTQQLQLTFKVVDGEFKGREINEWYSIICPISQQAVEISQRAIRQICESIGLVSFTQTEELHNKPMIVRVGHKEANADGDVYNRVKMVKPYGNVAPSTNTTNAAPPAQAGTDAATAPTAATRKKPWEN